MGAFVPEIDQSTILAPALQSEWSQLIQQLDYWSYHDRLMKQGGRNGIGILWMKTWFLWIPLNFIRRRSLTKIVSILIKERQD
ncbi:hypothetical protein RJ639_045243 [Escallonia herrerae]|uniref:Uncharacterized protein n=1 Tax=Escallonia herrerae TaxID=1293975 RepID=A0AA88W8J1_9ASTE|nr:hypothetical protein RJ639_045243 [Escallonia herrerae]